MFYIMYLTMGMIYFSILAGHGVNGWLAIMIGMFLSSASTIFNFMTFIDWDN